VYAYEFNKTAHGWSDRRGTRVKTALVVVDSSVAEGIPVESYDEDDRYFLFITNLPVDSQDTAFQLARDFRKRWCIETGYKTKKQFRGKTCSLSYAVRLFLILLSFVLYNIWICINSTLKQKNQWTRLEKPHVSSYVMMFLCMIHMFSRMIFTEK
jgi:IS4 transposase